MTDFQNGRLLNDPTGTQLRGPLTDSRVYNGKSMERTYQHSDGLEYMKDGTGNYLYRSERGEWVKLSCAQTSPAVINALAKD